MSEPKQRPILYSTEMVQAIESGWKTQTRRMNGLSKFNASPDDWELLEVSHSVYKTTSVQFLGKPSGCAVWSYGCPFGLPGDILYVRETWGMMDVPGDVDLWFPVYKAQVDSCGQVPSLSEKNTWLNYKDPWRPSLHMPKELARLWLKITDIRVERLQDIKPEDAVAEGIKQLKRWPEAPDKPIYKQYGDYLLPEERGLFDPIHSFYTLWCSIYGDDAVVKNPWVWVIAFERIDNPNLTDYA